MTVTIPEYVTAEGNVKVSFVPAIANVAAPTVTELDAGVDVTCYMPETWAGITGEQAKGTQSRMCTKESFESFGRTTRSVSDFTYTYLPQDDGTEAGNKVKAAMAAGTEGFLVVRYGLPATDAWAALQVVDTLAVETGVQNKVTAGSDEFAPLVITQSLIAKAPLNEDAVVAAGV